MIASECDVLVAVPDAWFAVPEVATHGLLGGGSHLRRLAPYFKAMRMLLLGERLDAAEALAFGTLESVVEPAALRAHALGQASRLAALAPIPARAARQIFRRQESDLASSGYRDEQRVLGEVVSGRST
jgi:enoyl-CoA hydratase/carnithine racemase